VFEHPGRRRLGTVALDGDDTIYANVNGPDRVDQQRGRRDRRGDR
jgi:hypothetical protein